MIWIIVAFGPVLGLVAALMFTRAASRPAPASPATIPAGDIGAAALSCQPGWEPAYILDATTTDSKLIIRTVDQDGRRTGLVLPADNEAALYAMSRLLALEGTPLAAEALAAAITSSRAGTVIATHTTEEIPS